MKTALWATAKVVPYDRNPRVITDEAVAKTAASIKEFGWRQPEALGRQEARVPGYHHAAGVDDDRLAPAELLYRGRRLRHHLVRDDARVAAVGLDFCDRPESNFHRFLP